MDVGSAVFFMIMIGGLLGFFFGTIAGNRSAASVKPDKLSVKPDKLSVELATNEDGNLVVRVGYGGEHVTKRVFDATADIIHTLAARKRVTLRAPSSPTSSHKWCHVLGVDSPKEGFTIVKSNYRMLIKGAHPDAGGSPALFRHVQTAYEEAERFYNVKKR